MTGARPDSRAAYWEARARDFATTGRGLRAVCSYGMPAFYNALIDASQRLAMAPWIRDVAGRAVLDCGCGVGRWSRRMARRGATVTGIDLSPSMVREAGERAIEDGVADRCRFLVADLPHLKLDRQFDLIVVVTVLQHILDPTLLGQAIRGLAAHLAPGGRIVALEAAPGDPVACFDHPAFTARTAGSYLAEFEQAGLACVRMTGVDPARFKLAAVGTYRRLPPIIARPFLALSTAAAAPIDLIAGRRLVRRSWHKVFVLERAGGGAS
jgi:SAM-dependent methyltransferase